MRGWIDCQLDDFRPLADCWIIPAGDDFDTTTKRIRVRALIDTGATDVALRPHHVATLGLASSEKRNVTRTNVTAEEIFYRVDVLFEGLPYIPATPGPRQLITNASAYATEMENAYDAIIGMTVLSALGLSFDPGGTFKILIP